MRLEIAKFCRVIVPSTMLDWSEVLRYVESRFPKGSTATYNHRTFQSDVVNDYNKIVYSTFEHISQRTDWKGSYLDNLFMTDFMEVSMKNLRNK